MKQKITKVLAGDINALLSAWNITDKPSIKLIKDISKTGGRLRTVTKVIRLASMFAKGGDEALGASHIKAAWRKLGGINQ